MALAAMLTIVTILMGIRLCRLRHLNMPVTDGRNSLVKHYLVFTIGYILRSINDYFVMYSGELNFVEEISFDISSLFNDAIPIVCLLVFHFQNFKPHQHELIIRLADQEETSTNGNELEADMMLI